MSTLLLLTNRYPFAPGEEYLNTEIPYLASSFDQVLVLPIMREPGTTHSRALPPNVEVLEMTISHRQRHRFNLLFRSLIQPSSRATKTSNPIHASYERYFSTRTREVLDLAEPLVRAASKDHTITSIYAYWFYITTSVAIGLRERIPALSNVPIVARGHGYDVNETASPLKYLPQRAAMLRAVSHLHPTADTITKRLQREWPEFSSRISTRRLGVTPAGYVEREDRQAINILSCSTLHPTKRVGLLARSVAEIKSRGVELHWTHIGSGTTSEERKFCLLVRRLGISDILTRTGQIPNTEVYEYLRRPEMTVFVNTSSSESVSFATTEALGAGLPIIATDVVGTHEIVSTGTNGLLLPSNPTPRQIADAVIALHAIEKPKYTAMCRESYRRCTEMFDPDTQYIRFAHDLKELSYGHH